MTYSTLTGDIITDESQKFLIIAFVLIDAPAAYRGAGAGAVLTRTVLVGMQLKWRGKSKRATQDGVARQIDVAGYRNTVVLKPLEVAVWL